MGRSLRTFSLLKGMPVFDMENGTSVGEVHDICISEEGSITGLLLRKGAFLKKNFLIPFASIASFGSGGVMIKTTSGLCPVKRLSGYTFENQHRICGKMLISREGEQLGLLEDVYFLEELGTIVGYELSDGFFSDITEGKKVVNSDEPPAFGKDAIIVNAKN